MNITEQDLTKLRKENADLQSALTKRADEIADLEARLAKVEQSHIAAPLGHSPNHTA